MPTASLGSVSSNGAVGCPWVQLLQQHGNVRNGKGTVLEEDDVKVVDLLMYSRCLVQGCLRSPSAFEVPCRQGTGMSRAGPRNADDTFTVFSASSTFTGASCSSYLVLPQAAASVEALLPEQACHKPLIHPRMAT